ncbi:MAG: molybdenum cofactor guanylyltransferase [Solirubrobacteraceae bacterium]|nr:molybdenum cofactor guanylyltransferase [Solirubrobacteraceae bacterium]
MARTAGIVLAGGRSSRMGAPKACLEWHGSTLVRRVAGILGRTLDGPVVIVRARGQALPELPDCEVVEDARGERGPLEGLGAGLRAVGERAGVAFVAGVDTPLLHPAFVGAILERLGPEDEICVPVTDGVPHPLAAAYRTGVGAEVAGLLRADRLRLGLLLERCRVRRVSGGDLPHPESLVNLNDPDDYAGARERRPPEIRLLIRSGLARAEWGGGGARASRAATLGQAAAAAGIRLGPGIAGTVNGRTAGVDPEVPLVEGDVVAFGPSG